MKGIPVANHRITGAFSRFQIIKTPVLCAVVMRGGNTQKAHVTGWSAGSVIPSLQVDVVVKQKIIII